MPLIILKKVLEVSSEDPEWPASNLLTKDVLKPWKIANPGLHQAHVTFELESPTKIGSFEIGNHGSAFVEVLVRNSVSDQGADFETLLSVSSFMVPSEAKTVTNINRVRLFPKEKLSPEVVNKTCNQIKVICTQPFNKEIKYGLDFFVVNAPEEVEAEELEGSQSVAIKCGAFSIKGAESLDDDEDEKPPAKRIVKIERSTDEARSQSPKAEKRRTLAQIAAGSPKKPQNVQKAADVAQASESKDRPGPSKPKPSTSKPNTRRKKGQMVEFSKVMSNVVFAISGIENPERRQIRDKALEMGAKYKPDWSKDCTHLVCAFVDTPKYKQVAKEKGKIVTKKWIEECFSKRTLLPWKDFQLGKYDRDSTDEEAEEDADDDDEEEEEYEEPDISDDDEWIPRKKKKDSPSDLLSTTTSRKNGCNQKTGSQTMVVIADSEDEDFSQKEYSSVKSFIEKSPELTKEDGDDKVFEIETDSEDLNMNELESKELPLLPSFFSGKTFYLHGDFNEGETKELRRVIIAYNGKLEQSLSKEVTHVISKSDWCEDFNRGLELNDTMLFIKPKWLRMCDQKQKLVPFHSYVIPADEDD